MEDQFNRFKTLFPDLTASLDFYTEHCETITFIDVESNRIEFIKSITLSCGCCGEYEQFDDDLDHFIGFLSDSDFQELTDILKNKHS